MSKSLLSSSIWKLPMCQLLMFGVFVLYIHSIFSTSLLDDPREHLTKPSPARCPSSCLHRVLWLTETSQACPDVSPAFLGTSLVKSKVGPSKTEPWGAVYWLWLLKQPLLPMVILMFSVLSDHDFIFAKCSGVFSCFCACSWQCWKHSVALGLATMVGHLFISATIKRWGSHGLRVIPCEAV